MFQEVLTTHLFQIRIPHPGRWFSWLGFSFSSSEHGSGLRRNGTPPLFDLLLFEINIENYFLLIGIICTLFANCPRSSVG